MAGEIAPRGRMGLKIAPPLIVSDLCFSKGEAVPEKALTMSGADRFSRRGGTCRLHAILVNQLCITWGYREKLSRRQSVILPSVLTSGCHDLMVLRGDRQRPRSFTQNYDKCPGVGPLSGSGSLALSSGSRRRADRAAITRICIFAWGRGGRAWRRARRRRAAAVRIPRARRA